MSRTSVLQTAVTRFRAGMPARRTPAHRARLARPLRPPAGFLVLGRGVAWDALTVCLRRRRRQGKPDDEGGAMSRLAVDIDRAAVRGDQGGGDGQPEPGAAAGAASRPVGAV